MRSGSCAGKAMNVESFAAVALDFPCWGEPRPSAKSAGGPEVPDESSVCESGYLSLKGAGPEGGDASGTADPASSSTVGCDYAEMQMKVDFFRKLGYSTEEVLVVLQKHGPHADTNTVLGELVRHGMIAGDRNPAASPLEAPVMPLVPRGGSASNSPAHGAPSEGREGENLRPVVIDGSNVAMSHGDKDVFSCRGILLAVNWFLDRGHTDITVFVPSWRKEQPRPDVPITDQHILRELEKKKILVFTPSRRVGGKRLVCYDDRFIVKLAYESDGVVVSNDVYRDLQMERPEWKKFIEERLLMYSFVNDKFMPPDDPLGRHGPSLDNFLRKKPVVPEHKKQQCPYGKKCTYGIKCKFYHPERLHQLQRSVADELRANARLSPTRGAAAAKEERRSRRPAPTEFPGPATTEGEKMPSQRAVIEKKSSLQKAVHSDVLCPRKGGVHLSSAPAKKDGGGESYRPPERGQPPPGAPRTDSLPCPSQERLDSGLGSLESQLSEMWPSHSAPSHRELLAWSSPSRGQRPVPPQPPGPESGSHGQHLPLPASGPQQLYGPDLSSVRLVGRSFPGYGLPADTPTGTGQKFWSEPYRPLATAGRDLPGAHQPAYSDASRPWAAPDRFAEERANVRIRLCGIFHPRLVDAVMSRFPQILDPQQLAAEILTYKSQNPSI